MRRIGLVSATAIVVLLLMALPVWALAPSSWYVATTGNDLSGDGSQAAPFATVQHAIDEASAGDSVFVGAGTFVEDITLKDGVSLYGGTAGESILRAASDGVITAVGIGAGTVVDGFTITGGGIEVGGGISCFESALTISNNHIVENFAILGGGIACVDSSVTVTGNIIENNSGFVGAGVIDLSEDAVSESAVDPIEAAAAASIIVDNDIRQNMAYEGGGIVSWGADTSISGNLITGNIAWAGAGVAAGYSDFSISGNIIVENTATPAAMTSLEAVTPESLTDGVSTSSIVDGAEGVRGMFGTYGGTLSVLADAPDAIGGGIVAVSARHPIENNLIMGNYAEGHGGGLAFGDASTVAINNTIIGNGAVFGPGVAGFYGLAPNALNGSPESDEPQVINSIVWGNTVLDEVVIPNLVIEDGAQLYGCTAVYSCVEGSTEGTGNISLDPKFVSVDDPYLQAGSPCLDAADASAAPDVDIAGTVRPQGAGVDMGAFERVVASISKPVAPKVMYTGVKTRVTGAVKPQLKAGSKLVRIYRYRFVSGKWKSYGYVSATASDLNDGSRYARSLALPRAGRWRLRAVLPADDMHSGAKSSYTYVTVKNRGQRIVDISRTLYGKGYRWGATGPNFFDSSGFTQYVYGKVGLTIPRTARSQYLAGPRVSTNGMRPGDLVFYKYSSRSSITHVGVYAGYGRMIDCNKPGGMVAMRKLYPNIVGATRPWK